MNPAALLSAVPPAPKRPAAGFEPVLAPPGVTNGLEDEAAEASLLLLKRLRLLAVVVFSSFGFAY